MRFITAKVLAGASCAMLAIGGLAACGGGNDKGDSGSGGTSTTASPDSLSGSKGPITIGAVKGFTGLIASFDGPPATAAEIAIDDINAAGGVGGRKLQLVKVDMQSKIEQGQQATQEALSKGATFIQAPTDFDFGAPVALAAQQEEVVAMSDGAAAPAFGKQGIGPYAFTMALAAPTEGAGMAQFAAESKHWKRAYVLRDTTLEYHKQVTSGFIDRFKELGGTIVGQDNFKNADASISTQLNRLRGADVDFVVLTSFPPGGAAALKQIRAAGVDLPIVTSSSFDGESWKKAVGGVSDVYFTAYGSLYGDDPSPERTKLFEAYKQRTGSAAENSNIVAGYSLVQAFKLAAERCDCLKGPKMVEALESFNDEPLLVGPTTFTSDLHIDATRPMVVMQIQGGKTSFLEELELKTPPKLTF